MTDVTGTKVALCNECQAWSGFERMDGKVICCICKRVITDCKPVLMDLLESVMSIQEAQARRKFNG